MKCALVFPPTADPTQPYLSLPCLAAFLRSQGRHTVNLIDANVAFFQASLTPSTLTRARDRVRKRLLRLERQNKLHPDDTNWYARAVQSLLKSPFIIDSIGQAVDDLSNFETFAAIEHLNNCKRTIHEAVELLSCAWAPISIKLGSASDLHFATPADVGHLVEDADNPFKDFLKTDTLPAIGDAGAVGISITYRDQILPAFTLSSLIQQNLPGVPVIMGGNLPSIWHEAVDECPDLFDWCDYMIAFEGETALDSLLTAIETGASPDKIPNLVYRRNDIIIKSFSTSEQLSNLPTPDYDQLPLKRYLSPEPVFSVYATRGCYWSRCAFCSVSPSMRGHHRSRDPELIHRDLSILHEKYNAHYFAFADDCIPPKTLLALSELLIEKGPKVKWQCEVRFESAFDADLLNKLKEAGCVNLIFGLESFSSRVLKKMNKGVSPELIAKVLASCRDVGIAFNLQFFFGFPGESEKEAGITKRFIEEQAYGPATFSFGIFELHKNSIIHRSPDKYNIVIEDRFNPLSIVLANTPKSAYAMHVKSELQESLRNRTCFPYAGISLNAHTIIFLAVAGVAALSNLYGPCKRHEVEWNETLSYAALTISPLQHIETFKFSTEKLSEQESSTRHDKEQAGKYTILYDYNLDRSVEISDLTVSVMAQIANGMTLNQIIGEFKNKIEDEELKRQLVHIVTEVVWILYEKGFIVKDR